MIYIDDSGWGSLIGGVLIGAYHEPSGVIQETKITREERK